MLTNVLTFLSGLWIFLVLAIVLPAYSEAAVFNATVGDTLESNEAADYHLFSELSGFRRAWIEAVRDRHQYCLRIEAISGTELTQDSLFFSPAAMRMITAWLDYADSLQAGRPVEPVECLVLTVEGYYVSGHLTAWTGPKFIIASPYAESHLPVEKATDLIRMGRQKPGARFKEAESLLTYDDPNRTRLFFVPTGRSLEKGEGYFSVYEVVLPGVQYGVGRNVSIGGGIFPFSGDEFFLGWLTGQVGIAETDKYAVAVGTMMFIISADEFNNVGICYTAGTYGTEDKAVSLGLGFGVEDWTRISDQPMVVLGGEYRLSRSTKLISENWIIPGGDWPVTSVGVRWFGPRISADFALIRPLDAAFTVIGIPWVDFVVHF